jgi:ribulose-phosphate 3-epimerase
MPDSTDAAWPPPSAPVLAPSLLAADFAHLADETRAVEAAGADWLHLDVMDGHFVPNISFGPLVLKALRPHTSLPFDVHLMIAPVDAYISAFAEAGADHISVHAEAGPNLHRTLQLIREHGCRAGVALNPATPAAMASAVLDDVDQILVMTVNPGFGGQMFLPSQLPKIRELRAMVGDRPVVIGVDGGITAETAPACIEAGATMLVAGTSVFGRPDRRAALEALRPATGAGRHAP